jgi:hypothetical protein
MLNPPTTSGDEPIRCAIVRLIPAMTTLTHGLPKMAAVEAARGSMSSGSRGHYPGEPVLTKQGEDACGKALASCSPSAARDNRIQ